MTVIAGLVCPHYGCLIADSRLTDLTQPGHGADVCLKIISVNGFGAFAWSGSLEALDPTFKLILGRAARKHGSADWLLDRRAVLAVLENAPKARALIRGRQVEQRLQLLFVGRFRGGVRLNPRELHERVAMVLIETAPFAHQVVDYGMIVGGVGQRIEEELFKEQLFPNWLHGNLEDSRENIAMKSFLPASRIAAHLGLSEPTVGGMLQIGQVIVGERFFYTPYEAWLETAPGEGTFARLRYDPLTRQFVQECPAANIRVPLLHPLTAHGQLRIAFRSTIDFRRIVGETAGLAHPTPNPVFEYRLLNEDGNPSGYGLVKQQDQDGG